MEIIGSADLEHLVPYAPFRKAVNQLHARQSAAGEGQNAQTGQSPSEESRANTRPPIVASATADMPDPGPTETWTGRAPSFQHTGFDVARQSAQLAMPEINSTSTFGRDDPNPLTADPEIVRRLSPEDYTRTADQLSGYITWNMSDLPFTSSGQQSGWMEGILEDESAFGHRYWPAGEER